MTEIAFIQEFLESGAVYALEKFESRKDVTVAHKRDANDLLTEVDLTLQKRVVDQIHERFPGDFILAEEGEYTKPPRDTKVRCWVIDPIDGTNNFVRGLFPIFGISIAFAMGGEAVAAGVSLPGRGAMLLAERGSGATMNGQRLQVSTTKRLAESRIDFDLGGSPEHRSFIDKTREIVQRAGQLRCFGSAVASIAQVATGDIDAYIHMTLSPWDYAAAQLLVEEAGGICSRHDGSPLRIFDGLKGCVISNPAVHEEILGLMQA